MAAASLLRNRLMIISNRKKVTMLMIRTYRSHIPNRTHVKQENLPNRSTLLKSNIRWFVFSMVLAGKCSQRNLFHISRFLLCWTLSQSKWAALHHCFVHIKALTLFYMVCCDPQKIFNVTNVTCGCCVVYEYRSTHTIHITVEIDSRNYSELLEIREDGKIEDLFTELQLNKTDYYIVVNGRRILNLQESFKIQNIKTNDRLQCTLSLQ